MNQIFSLVVVLECWPIIANIMACHIHSNMSMQWPTTHTFLPACLHNQLLLILAVYVEADNVTAVWGIKEDVLTCVCSTDWWGIFSSLSSSSKWIIAISSGCGTSGKPRESLEIQPQLADVIRNFFDCKGTGSCTASSIRARVPWISDVGCVCRDWGATCCGCNYT